jgi:hypothetical protein
MYNGNLKGEKLQNIIEKAKKPKVKKKREMRFGISTFVLIIIIH